MRQFHIVCQLSGMPIKFVTDIKKIYILKLKFIYSNVVPFKILPLQLNIKSLCLIVNRIQADRLTSIQSSS